jgi:hypothetical protein
MSTITTNMAPNDIPILPTCQVAVIVERDVTWEILTGPLKLVYPKSQFTRDQLPPVGADINIRIETTVTWD